jgi:hypothetical protein
LQLPSPPDDGILEGEKKTPAVAVQVVVADEVVLAQVGLPSPNLTDNDKKPAASSSLPEDIPMVIPIDSFTNVAGLPPKSTNTLVKMRHRKENRKKAELLKLHSSCEPSSCCDK